MTKNNFRNSLRIYLTNERDLCRSLLKEMRTWTYYFSFQYNCIINDGMTFSNISYHMYLKIKLVYKFKYNLILSYIIYFIFQEILFNKCTYNSQTFYPNISENRIKVTRFKLNCLYLIMERYNTRVTCVVVTSQAIS